MKEATEVIEQFREANAELSGFYEEDVDFGIENNHVFLQSVLTVIPC